MQIHQFIPYLRPGDAVGNHALGLQRILSDLGPSEIFVERVDPALRSAAKIYSDADLSKLDGVVYHAAVGSIMSAALLSANVPLAIDFHNITPSHFLAPYDVRAASLTLSGRIEIARFATRARLAIGHSEYSRRELDDLGFPKTAVFPVLIEFSDYDGEPDKRALMKLAGSKRGTDILFVGRISPHKRQEDLIKSFFVYRTHFDPGARLFIVGGGSSETYSRTLKRFVSDLGVEEVHFTGSVSFPEILAHYRNADVFLSMSEHEGFCVPLVEAMYLGVPVIAYGAAAVPETVADAGVVFEHKDHLQVAALIHTIASSETHRKQLIAAGRARAQEFRPDRFATAIKSTLEEALL